MNETCNLYEPRGSVPARMRERAWPGIGRWITPGRLLIVLLLLRLALSPWDKAKDWSDSYSYLEQSRLTVSRQIQGKWPNGQVLGRLSSYPLALKAAGINNLTSAENLWTAMAINAASTFAALAIACLCCFAVLPRARDRYIVMSALFAFSMSEFVFPWECSALTESFAVSGYLVLLGFLLALSTRGRRPAWAYIGVMLTVLFLMNLRESLLVAGPLAVLCIITAGWRRRVFEDAAPGSVPAPEPPQTRAVWRQAAAPASICVIVLLTLAGVCGMRSRAPHQQVNLAHFVSIRLLTDQAATAVLDREGGLPPDVDAVRNKRFFEGWADRPDRLEWLSAYSNRHASLLVRNPKLAFGIMRRAALETISGISTNDRNTWLSGYGYMGRNFRHTGLLSVSYAINDVLCAPVWLLGCISPDLVLIGPFIILIVSAFRPCRWGLCDLWPIILMLAGMFYSQYALSALYDGIETSRHAQVGSASLVMLSWVAIPLFASSKTMKASGSAASAGGPVQQQLRCSGCFPRPFVAGACARGLAGGGGSRRGGTARRSFTAQPAALLCGFPVDPLAPSRTALLAAAGHFVDGRPRARFRFIFVDAAFSVSLLDMLRLAFLLVCVG